jgi:hypothetical protein
MCRCLILLSVCPPFGFVRNLRIILLHDIVTVVGVFCLHVVRCLGHRRVPETRFSICMQSMLRDPTGVGAQFHTWGNRAFWRRPNSQSCIIQIGKSEIFCSAPRFLVLPRTSLWRNVCQIQVLAPYTNLLRWAETLIVAGPSNELIPFCGTRRFVTC